MNNDLLKNYIHGRSCEILGLGVSNLPLAHVLCDMGIDLTVRDKKELSELGPEAFALSQAGVKFICGNGCFDSLDGSVIFRSPGIRPDLPALLSAVSHGHELTSEMELFLRLTDAQTFAVTGSDGKTTSTTLVGKFLSAEAERTRSGSVFVGGNIGTPLLDRLSDISCSDRAVMELSSFQLMTVKRSPQYSAITNISPNHLDWHRHMDEYISAKTNIIGKNTLRFVTNADCPHTARIAEELIQRRQNGECGIPAVFLFSSTRGSFDSLFSQGFASCDRAIYEKDGWIVISNGKEEEKLLDISHIRIPGRHNVENFMTAMALVYGCVDPSVFHLVADSFYGVEHRLEWVRNFNGTDYYNSSIDSSPTRTAAALSALKGRDIVIICGGYDKKIPFEPLAESLCLHARAVVLTGATGERIGQVLQAHPLYRFGKPEIAYAPDFRDAVFTARSLARENGCVLLSPACASFDAFRNFAERGRAFREIVENFKSQ